MNISLIFKWEHMNNYTKLQHKFYVARPSEKEAVKTLNKLVIEY